MALYTRNAALLASFGAKSCVGFLPAYLEQDVVMLKHWPDLYFASPLEPVNTTLKHALSRHRQSASPLAVAYAPCLHAACRLPFLPMRAAVLLPAQLLLREHIVGRLFTLDARAQRGQVLLCVATSEHVHRHSSEHAEFSQRLVPRPQVYRFVNTVTCCQAELCPTTLRSTLQTNLRQPAVATLLDVTSVLTDTLDGLLKTSLLRCMLEGHHP